MVSLCLQTNILRISGVDISESKRCYDVIPSIRYFYIKTNILADFQICISVPLRPWLCRTIMEFQNAAGSKTNLPCDTTSYNFRNGSQEKMNMPALSAKTCCNKDQKITNRVINKQYRLDFFRIWINWQNILLCSIYMDSVIFLSVLSFSDGLNLLKEAGFSLIFVLFVLEHFTPDLSGGFKLTSSLESTVPERM